MEEKIDRIIPFIKILSEVLEKRANFELKEYNTTIGQVRILGVLYLSETGECSLKELENIFCTAQATIAGIVARLENKKLIVAFTDPTDRRIKKIMLTEKGKKVIDKAQAKMLNLEAWFTSNLENDEKKELLRLLYKVYDTVK